MSLIGKLFLLLNNVIGFESHLHKKEFHFVLINGEPRGYITPSRGIKHDDSLSPYIFLLCAEGLSSLIHHAVTSQNLHGILSCTNGVCISHLLFADDSFIFCQAIERECQHLLKLLSRYEQASGQAIKRQKTTLFFSRNTKMEVKVAIQGMRNARIMENHEKYLGLPMVGGKSKVNTFKELEEKITRE